MNVAELKRQVEHKFAPEPLLAVQALANTYSYEDDEERLADPATTRRWLVESGLASESVEVGAEEHEHLREVRRVIRGVLQANLEADAEPDLEALGRLAATHPAPLAVSSDGVLGLDLDPVGSVGKLTGQILGIMFEARTRDELRRLKICASDDCRWAFYDSSKNRGGTWCRMEECGNRVKNRRYRARRASE